MKFYKIDDQIVISDKGLSVGTELVADMKIEAFNDMACIEKALDLRGKTLTVIPYGGYVLPQNTQTYQQLNGEFQKNL